MRMPYYISPSGTDWRACYRARTGFACKTGREIGVTIDRARRDQPLRQYGGEIIEYFTHYDLFVVQHGESARQRINRRGSGSSCKGDPAGHGERTTATDLPADNRRTASARIGIDIREYHEPFCPHR